jgi:CIC family chloride channel protein
MAAVLAGTTHAAVTAVLMIFEMTGNYGMMLPLMLACVIATAVSRRLEGNSLYTGVLRRRNVVPPAAPRPAWLQ